MQPATGRIVPFGCIVGFMGQSMRIKLWNNVELDGFSGLR